jgi:hypothetical protein
MSVPASSLFDVIGPHVGEAGTCDEKIYLRALSQALSLIWPIGDWEGTVVRCRLPVDGQCCVRLPWQIEKIRTAWYGKNLAPVNDHLYEGLVSDDIVSCGECQCPRIINSGASECLPVDPDLPAYIAIQFNNEEPGTRIGLVYSDMSGVRKVFEAVASEDKARHITPELVSKIVMVSKPKTNNPVLVLRCDTSKCSKWKQVGYYHPAQINPTYSVVKVVGVPANSTILVRAKLRCPVIHTMDDPVPIENAHALALAVRAVAHLGRNRDAYAASLKDAVDLLRVDSIDDFDHNGIAVEVDAPLAVNLMPRL